MTACPVQTFYVKLRQHLNGGHPTFSAAERPWLRAFRAARSAFASFTAEEMLGLSYEAIARCRRRGRAGRYAYVLKALLNRYRDARGRRYRKRNGRRRKRPLPPPKPTTYDMPWDAVDARLDLDDALAKLRAEDATLERALRVRLRPEGHTHRDVARELGVSDRHAKRIVQQAEARLRYHLRSYEQA